MTIAAYATGCEHGYLYVRGEYPLATRRMRARDRGGARARGFLGDDVLGHGFAFDIELRRGAGAYICGEETAIFGSIEGYRGEPRNKPPFPGRRGPVPAADRRQQRRDALQRAGDRLEGGPAFADDRRPSSSTGTKLFCVAARSSGPASTRSPFGTTLRELFELAGGVPPNLRTVLLGGAAGMFVTPDELDMRAHVRGHARVGRHARLGRRARDRRPDGPRPLLMVIAAFFRDESCGQCVPCRVGTVRQEEALARLLSGRTRGSVQDELALIAEIGEAMRDASICGLGQTASSAIESAIGEVGSVRMTQRMVSLTIDDQPVEVPEGSTILQACAEIGIDTPTLCYGETLQPANACRVCVVELEGARVLAPSCARTVEAGHGRPDRLRARPRTRARW